MGDGKACYCYVDMFSILPESYRDQLSGLASAAGPPGGQALGEPGHADDILMGAPFSARRFDAVSSQRQNVLNRFTLHAFAFLDCLSGIDLVYCL